MRHQFRAEWDKTVKVITFGVIALIVGLSVFFLLLALAESEAGLSLAIVLPPLVLIVSTLFMIRGYVVTESQLIIPRLLWSNKFELSDLTEVTVEPHAMAKSIRMMGSGGFFGFFGRFRNQELGNYQAFVTDRSRSVVLKFGSKTIVVSPHDPHDFVDKVNRAREGELV